jgi:hypothetical protein
MSGSRAEGVPALRAETLSERNACYRLVQMRRREYIALGTGFVSGGGLAAVAGGSAGTDRGNARENETTTKGAASRAPARASAIRVRWTPAATT